MENTPKLLAEKVQHKVFSKPDLNSMPLPTFSVHKGPANVDDVTDVTVRLYVVRIRLSQPGQVVAVAVAGIGVGAVHDGVRGTG